MGLILRTQLPRPLTHAELDSNFTYLEMIEWVKKDYVVGQFVFNYDPVSTETVIYQCIVSHLKSAYTGSTFNTTVNIDGVPTVAWRIIASSNSKIKELRLDGTILVIEYWDGTTYSLDLTALGYDVYPTGYTMNGTILTIHQSDDTEDFDINLNDIVVSGATVQTGISTHGYIKLSELDFNSDLIENVFPNAPTGQTIEYHQITTGSTIFKSTYVIVDMTTGLTENYFILLPQVGSDEIGKVVKVMVKRNGIPSNSRRLLICIPYITNGSARIIAPSIKTYVTNVGYFIPMETLESVELLWDGLDWLVCGITKHQYVEIDANNYLTDVSNYIIRDINTLL